MLFRFISHPFGFAGVFAVFLSFARAGFTKIYLAIPPIPVLQSKKGYSVPMIFTNKKEAVFPHLCRALDSEWNGSAGGNRPEPPNCPVTRQTAKAVVFPFSRLLGQASLIRGCSRPARERWTQALSIRSVSGSDLHAVLPNSLCIKNCEGARIPWQNMKKTSPEISITF